MTMTTRVSTADAGCRRALALVVAFLVLATAEIQEFNILLPATSSSIRYTDLYLRGPGFVDVSNLVLTAVSDVHKSYYPSTQDDGYDQDDDDGSGMTDFDDDGDDDGDDDAAVVDDDADDDGDDAKGEDDDEAADDDSAEDDTATAADDDEDHDGGPALEDDDDASAGGKPAGTGGITPTHPQETTIPKNGGNDGGNGGNGTGRRLYSAEDSRSSGLRWKHLEEQGPMSPVDVAVAHRSRRMERSLDDTGRSIVDFVAFRLPDECANTKAGCDWPSLGIGAQHADGTLRWCCSNEAVALGLCKGEDELGRLIVDQAKLPGKRRQIAIPNSGEVSKAVNNGLIDEQDSGNYVLIMANCDDGGRDVLVTGDAAYKSVHGYLPGELWGFLYFFAAMTIAYLVVSLWYGIMMHLNLESRIPIEKWILTTIVLGLGEMAFKTADAFVWNDSGHRQLWLCYVGIILGVIKRGWSRSLIVMVSLGWGVTRDSLGRKYKWIFMLCMLYIGLSAFCDLTIVIAVTEMETLSQNVETNLYDIYTLLTFIIAAVDVIYVMWILDALASTMETLDSMNQSRKLKRYLRLRCLFLFSVLFAAAWAIFAVTNAFADGIVGEEDSWIVDSATELNYLVVMFGIACLWRPSASAKEYAYAMELPSSNYEGDGLEMSGAGVPSAVDSDDEYDDGYVDTKQGRNNGAFQDEPSPRQIT